MPLVTKDVKPVMDTYECDDCGHAMEATDKQLLDAHPPKLIHVCPKCAKSKALDGRFPMVRFVDAKKKRPKAKAKK